MGGSHGMWKHGMRPISDKAHESTETPAQEREEHRLGKEAKHMFGGGPSAGIGHVPMPAATHGAKGRGGGRRSKSIPGVFYTEGMGGMCHRYTGDGDGEGVCGNSHEFKGGGKKGKTPFLKKLLSKKG